MKIIDSPITRAELKRIAQSKFGNLVKAVVDIEKGILAIDAELHADEEALLLEHNSDQKNLWGINLYPDLQEDDWIEFDSMINVRPSTGNLTRGVDNLELQRKIIAIVSKLIQS